jgi:hypothetical protein
MTQKRLIVDICIAAVVITLLFVATTHDEHTLPEVTEVPVHSTSAYVVATGSYPQFPDLPQPFNESIQKLIERALAEHELQSKENWDARYETQMPDEHIPQTPSEDETYMFTVESKITRNDDAFTSVIVKFGGYAGGAHGYRNMQTFTFDKKKQAAIVIEDIYTQAELNEISQRVTSKLITDLASTSHASEQDIDTEWISQGAGPYFENYKHFTLNSDNTISFYFTEYQVAAYAAGEQMVTIPFK